MEESESDLRDVIVSCISSLAMSCDHAQSIDAIGFSKSTAGPGHEIAALGANLWNREIWDYASRVSAHHSRQLERTGAIDVFTGERLRVMAGTSHVQAPEIPTLWIDVADVDGREMIVLSMHASMHLPKLLMNLPEKEVYRPAGVGRLWRVDEKWAFAIKPHLDEFQRVGAAVPEILDRSDALATDEMRMIVTDLPILTWNDQTKRFTMPFRFERGLGDRVRSVGGHWEKGATWNDCQASLPANRLAAELIDANEALFIHPDAAAALEEARKTAPSKEVQIKAGPPTILLEDGPGNTFVVRTSQYMPAWIGAIKTVPSRTWDGESKTWRIPATGTALEMLAGALHRADPERTQEIVADLRARIATMDMGDAPTLVVEPHTGKFLKVSMPTYVAAWGQAISNLPRNDRRWEAETKTWYVRRSLDTFERLHDAILTASQYAGSPAFYDDALAVIERQLNEIRGAEHDVTQDLQIADEAAPSPTR